MGSGDWYRWQRRKTTVQESLTLAVKDFRGRLHPHSSTFTWTATGGHRSCVGYSVRRVGQTPVVTFEYRWRDSEDVRLPVHLQTTPTQFGGERWWFTCPLIVNGVACNRRAGKLFLPPGARYFGCRKCHGLTYRSCQEAHQAERLTGSIEGMAKYLDALKVRDGIE